VPAGLSVWIKRESVIRVYRTITVSVVSGRESLAVYKLTVKHCVCVINEGSVLGSRLAVDVFYKPVMGVEDITPTPAPKVITSAIARYMIPVSATGENVTTTPALHIIIASVGTDLIETSKTFYLVLVRGTPQHVIVVGARPHSRVSCRSEHSPQDRDQGGQHREFTYHAALLLVSGNGSLALDSAALLALSVHTRNCSRLITPSRRAQRAFCL